MAEKKTKSALLLERARIAKQKEPGQALKKKLGKGKNKAKFVKVNFNG